MRTVPGRENTSVTVETETSLNKSLTTSSSDSLVSHKSYHELSDRTVIECDALSQLSSNIEMLADLQSRFSFLMREVRYVLKV